MSVQGVTRINARDLNLFQYILCVGSRLTKTYIEGKINEFQYILCVGSSVATALEYLLVNRFQYILCVGSSLFSEAKK